MGLAEIDEHWSIDDIQLALAALDMYDDLDRAVAKKRRDNELLEKRRRR